MSTSRSSRPAWVPGRRAPAPYPRHLRAVAAITLGLLSAVSLGACGSSYTRRDLIARADAICASAIRQTLAIGPPTFGGSSSQQLEGLAQYLARALPIYQSETAQLRGLRAPAQSASDKAKLSRFLQAVSQAAADFRALLASAKQRDPQGVASAEAALRANPVSALAASYGLKSCGAPGATVS